MATPLRWIRVYAGHPLRQRSTYKAIDPAMGSRHFMDIAKLAERVGVLGQFKRVIRFCDPGATASVSPK